jgi:hypothetical protein
MIYPSELGVQKTKVKQFHKFPNQQMLDVIEMVGFARHVMF